jgi:hypothetical protein
MREQKTNANILTSNKNIFGKNLTTHSFSMLIIKICEAFMADRKFKASDEKTCRFKCVSC